MWEEDACSQRLKVIEAAYIFFDCLDGPVEEFGKVIGDAVLEVGEQSDAVSVEGSCRLDGRPYFLRSAWPSPS